jgi:autophagy-related protein 9
VRSFVTFISGSFAAVLFFVSVFEPELFLTFQLTPDRTVFFYFGIFTAIFAAARNLIPEENLVFEPEPMLAQVIEYTHYCPEHWNGRLHSDEVHSPLSTPGADTGV